MSNIEILSLLVTALCLISFCLVFTFLFRHYYLSNIDDVNKGRADVEVIELEKENFKKRKGKYYKAKKIAGKTVGYTLFALVLVLFAGSLYARFFNNNLTFGDTGLVVISSGSMSQKNEANDYLFENDLNNQFNTYDIIGISAYKSVEEVKQYDVIAYKNEEGTIIVHRVIEVKEVNGENVFITRGDSNNTSDTNFQYRNYLTFDNIIGYYNDFKIPMMGVFVIFLQSNAGIITIIAIGYCLIMFDYYNSKLDTAIFERSNLLVSTLNLDYEKAVPIESYYSETVVYNDQFYNFVDGNFVNKTEINKETLNTLKENTKNENSEEIVENCEENKNFFKKTFNKIKLRFSQKNKK